MPATDAALEFGNVTADNDHDDPYTSQLVILDAVTGDLIDPVPLSESLNITADEDWGFIAEN